MKMIFILLMSFFLINSAQADWKQINCIDYVPKEELSLSYKKRIPLSDNLELHLFYKANDSCRYEIRSLNRGRKFTFYKDEFNFIQLRNDFTDQIGIATYFSYPKKTELKVYKDSKTGNVKVIQPNESEIFSRLNLAKLMNS